MLIGISPSSSSRAVGTDQLIVGRLGSQFGDQEAGSGSLDVWATGQPQGAWSRPRDISDKSNADADTVL